MIGWNAFLALLIFLSILFALLAVFAFATYPRLADFALIFGAPRIATGAAAEDSSEATPRPRTTTPRSGAQGDTQRASDRKKGADGKKAEVKRRKGAVKSRAKLAIGAWQEARTEWFGEIRQIGQLYLVAPLIPLLGTVLGYIFGRQQETT